jgi:hypothetical protein
MFSKPGGGRLARHGHRNPLRSPIEQTPANRPRGQAGGSGHRIPTTQRSTAATVWPGRRRAAARELAPNSTSVEVGRRVRRPTFEGPAGAGWRGASIRAAPYRGRQKPADHQRARSRKGRSDQPLTLAAAPHSDGPAQRDSKGRALESAPIHNSTSRNRIRLGAAEECGHGVSDPCSEGPATAAVGPAQDGIEAEYSGAFRALFEWCMEKVTEVWGSIAGNVFD